MQTIRQQYLSRSLQDATFLKFGSKLLSDPTTMKDLNKFGDNVIAIEAIRPADMPTRMQPQSEPPRHPEQPAQTRKPLQPSNMQSTVKPALLESEAFSTKAVSDLSYESPYAPGSVSPVTLRTVAKIKAQPKAGRHGFSPPVTRMCPNLPVVDVRAKPTANGQDLQRDVQSPVSAEERNLMAVNSGVGNDIQPFEQLLEDTDGGRSQESDVKEPSHFQLQTMLAGAAPEVLEAAVERGVEVLEELKNPLVEKAPHARDAAQWLQQIGRWIEARCNP